VLGADIEVCELLLPESLLAGDQHQSLRYAATTRGPAAAQTPTGRNRKIVGRRVAPDGGEHRRANRRAAPRCAYYYSRLLERRRGMIFRVRRALGASLLCAIVIGPAAVAADRTPPKEGPDTKISVVPEPTESPRFLWDERQVTQGSITLGGHALAYDLHQLPMQVALRDNIEMHFYTSGHMVYAHEPELKALHANVAAFISRTKNSAVR
jgi:hypothetical protein